MLIALLVATACGRVGDTGTSDESSAGDGDGDGDGDALDLPAQSCEDGPVHEPPCGCDGGCACAEEGPRFCGIGCTCDEANGVFCGFGTCVDGICACEDAG